MDERHPSTVLAVACCFAAGRGLFFNGEIDDVMVFSRALGAREVAAIYTAQR